MLDNVSKSDKQQQYIDEHERLANLFVTNRFAFELERKRILNETIDTMHTSEKRRADQKELDRIFKGMGSADNRFAMVQALLWHHLFNHWQPDLQEQLKTLNTLVRGMHATPVLRVLEQQQKINWLLSR